MITAGWANDFFNDRRRNNQREKKRGFHKEYFPCMFLLEKRCVLKWPKK